MATKIRLQRHGKKGKPFFHIVAADSRSKRDGRFIEKVGTYNPNTNPATIDLDFEAALKWVSTGAEMSDTAKNILSYKGVLHMNHLNRGVLKGALTEEQAKAKFEKWLQEKEAKVQEKVDKLGKQDSDAKNKALAAEKEVNAARAKDIIAKNYSEEEAAKAAAAEAAAPAEEATVVTEAPAETAPVAEAAPEAPAATPAEEAPAAEEKKEA